MSERSIYYHPHRVTYAECTVGNHVYYSRYLDMLEEARGEFVRHLGVTALELQEQGFIFPVVDVQLRYLGAARYDDVLEIAVWLKTIGRVRLTFAYVVRRGEQELLKGTTGHVCTDLHEKVRRAPEDLMKRFEPFVANDDIEPETNSN